MNILNDERGQFSSAMLFIFTFAILMFIFAFTLPMLQNQAVHYYAAQEDIVADSLAVSENITDAEVKASFQNTLEDSQDAQMANVEILGLATVYGALLIIIIAAGAIFLNGRKITQQGLG